MNNLFVYGLFICIIFLAMAAFIYWVLLGWNPGVAP